MFYIITTSGLLAAPFSFSRCNWIKTPTNVWVLFMIYDVLLQIPVLNLCMFFHSDTGISVRGEFLSFSSSESGKFPFIPHELWLLVSSLSELHSVSQSSSSKSLSISLDLSTVYFQDQFYLLLSKKSLISIIFIIYLLSFQELPQSPLSLFSSLIRFNVDY